MQKRRLKCRKGGINGSKCRKDDGNAERAEEKGTMQKRRLKCRKGNNAETTIEMQKGRKKREQMQKRRLK
jgi:hypothetical protein